MSLWFKHCITVIQALCHCDSSTVSLWFKHCVTVIQAPCHCDSSTVSLWFKHCVTVIQTLCHCDSSTISLWFKHCITVIQARCHWDSSKRETADKFKNGTNWLTALNSHSWETNRSASRQEILRSFITTSTTAFHLPLSTARAIQSMPPHLTSLSSILILSYQLRVGLPGCLFPLCLLTKTLYAPLLPSICAACTAHLFLLDLLVQLIFLKWI